MPGDDHPVELQNLLFEPAQLSPQCGETGTGYRRNARVSWIGDDIEQRLNTLASDRRDDPELGKMSPDYIDHRCLLANEQMISRQKWLLQLRFLKSMPPRVNIWVNISTRGDRSVSREYPNGMARIGLETRGGAPIPGYRRR